MTIIQKQHTREGFTLVELMIVILIIGAIMGLAVGLIRTVQERMRLTKAQATVRELGLGIDNYKADTEELPQKLTDLIKKPSRENAAKKWAGPYFGKKGITEIPADPWDNDYKYKVTKGGKHPYELYSEGPGEEGPKIDIWEL